MISDEELRALNRKVWEEGILRGLLLDHQRKLYDSFYQSDARKKVWLCSRRLGKSSAALVLALETCLRKSNAIVRYGAAHQKDVREIIHPLMRILTRSCPEDVSPIWHQSEGKYKFPKNGSTLVVSGLDEGRADNLRGTYSDLIIVDEAGIVDDLDYAIKSVLMPQLMTTNGQILLATTPPKTPAHSFIDYYVEAERNNAVVKMTIHEDSRPEMIALIPEFQKEAGGEKSTTWRREYLCEIVTDEESAVVPEFSDPLVRANCVKVLERPAHFISYSIGDLGLIDFTAVVFGYVDFLNAKKVIVDEFIVNRKDSRHIAESILAKEKHIWGTDEAGLAKHTPRRYLDGPALTIQDFNSLHNLACTPVAKDELDAMTNELRLDVASGKLVIHPRCTETIRHLQFGIWDKQHRSFARTKEGGFGHFDLLAAVMYFIRHTNLRENPYPVGWGTDLHTQLIRSQNRDSYTEDALKRAFNLKKP